MGRQKQDRGKTSSSDQTTTLYYDYMSMGVYTNSTRRFKRLNPKVPRVFERVDCDIEMISSCKHLGKRIKDLRSCVTFGRGNRFLRSRNRGGGCSSLLVVVALLTVLAVSAARATARGTQAVTTMLDRWTRRGASRGRGGRARGRASRVGSRRGQRASRVRGRRARDLMSRVRGGQR